MKKGSSSAGFSLIEVVLALGIASFCLIPLLGLLPVGLKSHQIANEQTRMAHIASMIVQDLQDAGAETSPRFGFGVAASNAGIQTLYFNMAGTPTGSVGSSPVSSDVQNVSYYCATVDVSPPDNAQPHAASSARVMITWPALADKPGNWPTHYTGIFQTVVALNRN